MRQFERVLGFLAVIVLCTGGVCQAADPTPKAERPAAGYFKAEVRGLLLWKDSRYRVIVPPQERLAKEFVLDLWISENKSLVQQLQGLLGKQVVVSGNVVWVPKGAQVASDADYTLGFTQFEIKQAPKF